MKTVLVALFFAVTLVQEPKVITLEATFVEYEDDTFYFEDKDEMQFTFSIQDDVSKKQFDLTKSECIGKKFKIKYVVVTEIDDEDNEYEVNKIIGLELIK